MSFVEENPDDSLITFGVLSDVQYADHDDLPAGYDPLKTRFYRGALNHVDTAFDFWKKSHKVKFVLQLGDVIDGLNVKRHGSESALLRTLGRFEQHDSIPTFHTVGNHELYNFERRKLAEMYYRSFTHAKISQDFFHVEVPHLCDAEPILYYKFCPNPSIKFISLDCYDISVLGYDVKDEKYQEAAELLSFWHGHGDFDDWDSNGELKEKDVRFQQMNGAIGKEQMRWLEKELEESDRLEQQVFIFGHVGLHPDSVDWSCLVWNYEEVLHLFHHHNCVKAYFSGHSHSSNCIVDSYGVNFVVFTAIVETPPESRAFATVSIHPDRMDVHGEGEEKSYVLPLRTEEKVDAAFSDLSPSHSIKVNV